MPTQSYDLVVRSCCRTDRSAYRLQERRLSLLSYGASRCTLVTELRGENLGALSRIRLKIYTNKCFVFGKK